MMRSLNVHRCTSLSVGTGNVDCFTMSGWGTTCEHLVLFTTAILAPT